MFTPLFWAIVVLVACNIYNYTVYKFDAYKLVRNRGLLIYSLYIVVAIIGQYLCLSWLYLLFSHQPWLPVFWANNLLFVISLVLAGSHNIATVGINNTNKQRAKQGLPPIPMMTLKELFQYRG